MDLNALESFVLSAETLNFSQTAQRRNTVQSAISAQIRKLEQEVGHKLFDRGRGKAMTLTPEGRALAVQGRRILGLADEAVRSLDTARQARPLRLGTTVTLALSVVPEALAETAGQTRVEIDCDRSDRLLARLDAGDIDVALMMDQGRRSDRAMVVDMPLVWVAAHGFALAPDADVPLVFLTDGRDLRSHAFAALDRVGRRGFLAHLSPHPIGLRALVQAGLAVTIMPQAAVREPLYRVSKTAGLPALPRVALSLYRRTGADVPGTEALTAGVRRAICSGDGPGP
ncbi:LysR family transcriptional regulator [Jannaschia pagri]|uniref:LysR family transcriptional regulator n=1 Tax=Jannaschia pagri TaxID=2829797 RepID=A0ABQ4NHI0_9RHOB|nr:MULTISPECIES: LysR family transcriptional regulator [unclassified Jannaschia]GIT90029.1 LysR family transcriptional regulator [Jannaschia sp. AI_61]GIT93865.1 LysR family transcriptional regulator [Jannaschia sp. AI_62]